MKKLSDYTKDEIYAMEGVFRGILTVDSNNPNAFNADAMREYFRARSRWLANGRSDPDVADQGDV